MLSYNILISNMIINNQFRKIIKKNKNRLHIFVRILDVLFGITKCHTHPIGHVVHFDA